MAFDWTILEFVRENLHTDIGDILLMCITKLGDAGIFWILLCGALLISRKYRKTGVLLLITLAVDVLLCNVILKNVVARTRPFDINTTVEFLIDRPYGYSFPSGHTAVSFASAGALYFRKEKFRHAALVLAALIGFSRVYFYVHYPTDILGGIATGLASSAIAYLIFRKLEEWKKKKQRTL